MCAIPNRRIQCLATHPHREKPRLLCQSQPSSRGFTGCFCIKLFRYFAGTLSAQTRMYTFHCIFFGFKTVYFGRKFWKKMSKKGGEGGSSPIQKKSLQIYAYLRIFWKKAQCNFQKGTWGGSRPFGNFPKKHPHLGRQTSLTTQILNTSSSVA